MPLIGRRSLSFKKSKGNMQKSHQAEEHFHTRSMSTSSTISHASSTGSNVKANSYDPLSLHPPLSFNTSPVLPEFDTSSKSHHEDSGNTTHLNPEDLPTPTENFYYNQDCRRKTYVYDQAVQWPLKDWQAVPPGLANMAEHEFDAQTTPRKLPTDQRRPPKDSNLSEMDMFVKRGEWKRKGIVFGLGSDYEDEQEEHFELPEPEPRFEFF
ncbi:hypothetical protein PGQ11_014084 [Apiospora arundinis]|uniref:Uncharacterized protein n=1 Tax=Apiospora arundinis TaxID=335852 RepID=A0ABR2HRZ9_9PEZI